MKKSAIAEAADTMVETQTHYKEKFLKNGDESGILNMLLHQNTTLLRALVLLEAKIDHLIENKALPFL